MIESVHDLLVCKGYCVQLDGKITSFFSNTTTTVRIQKDQFMNGVLELVTVHGRLFNLLEDEGFKKITGPICLAFNLNFNRHNITDHIHERFEVLRLKLSNLVKNRLIIVKVDCVTRLDRSFLGVNIQFMHQGKLLIITLSVVELKVRHIAVNLKNIIYGELLKYEIQRDQVYTVTSDSSANIVKTVKLMNEDLQNQEIENDDGGFLHNNDDSVDGNASNLLCDRVTECDWKQDCVHGSPFSQDLIDNFTKRRDMLFEHDVFLATLYLDPRFQFEMTDTEKLTAIKHLKFLHLKLKSIQSGRNEILEESDTDAESVLCSSGLEDLAPDTEELMELKYEKSLARKRGTAFCSFLILPKRLQI